MLDVGDVARKLQVEHLQILCLELGIRPAGTYWTQSIRPAGSMPKLSPERPTVPCVPGQSEGRLTGTDWCSDFQGKLINSLINATHITGLPTNGKGTGEPKIKSSALELHFMNNWINEQLQSSKCNQRARGKELECRKQRGAGEGGGVFQAKKRGCA